MPGAPPSVRLAPLSPLADSSRLIFSLTSRFLVHNLTRLFRLLVLQCLDGGFLISGRHTVKRILSLVVLAAAPVFFASASQANSQQEPPLQPVANHGQS